MQAFVWDPSFETHLGDVDAQHHRLVELVNELGSLLAEGGEVSAEVVEQCQRDLTRYALYHFGEEERLMAEAAVDDRHRERQHVEHRMFREYVSSISAASADQGRQLIGFLVHWLTYHILGTDQAMARQIHAIRGGAAPALAFAAELERDDPISRVLLRSVGELFDLLAARNGELTTLNRTLEQRVAERTQALSAANQELRAVLARVEHMAMTDSLTGLPNRRYAMARLAATWAAAVRHVRSLACLVVDADGFKHVNDTSGHEAGDLVLRRLAEALRAGVRESDEVCRLGGDEFVVICPETTLPGALELGERLRAAVARLHVALADGVWDGSISVGASAMRPGMSSFEDLLRAADAGVYEAKRRGRNCVAPGPEEGGRA